MYDFLKRPLWILSHLLVVVAVVAMVAWALQLLQAAADRREFSLMLAGGMVCCAAVGLAAVMVPFRQLQLCDLGAKAAVPFSVTDLAPGLARRPDAAVGWIGQHRPLMQQLLDRLEAHPAITLQLGTLQAPRAVDLVVAADGPHSPTRDALGVGVTHWSYRQSCLTALVQLRGSGADEAWELLRPEGPFAVLPLGDGLVQVVWSAPQGRCRQLESLGDAAFLDALAGALPDRFQPDALRDQPRAFPVALQWAHRLHRGNTVLVGESGHRCHPVGGQGLNLCWRDVAQLHRLALRVSSGRLAVERLPAAYGWRRWPEKELMRPLIRRRRIT